MMRERRGRRTTIKTRSERRRGPTIKTRVEGEVAQEM
jgi:hypothetical protein